MATERKILLVATSLALALLIGGWLMLRQAQGDDRFADCRETVVSGGTGALGGEFTLVDTESREVTSAEILDRPALLYFGYAQCPDVCPLDNARNSEAAALLQSEGHDVLPVFVTVDPKRDTVEAMKDYAQVFDPPLVALTGSEAQIDQAAKAWRVYYNLHDDGTDPYYLVDHSTYTYLVLPEDGTVEIFSRDTAPDDMAERVGCFIDAASS